MALTNASLALWTVWLVPLAWIAEDLLSGLTHWSADTFGTEETLFLGTRFIRSFRVHHINANDILVRPFAQLNGDVALGVLPILVATFFVPPASRLFLVLLALFILPTNQIHQWAHRPAAPRIVRVMQRLRLILGPDEHRRHHTEPNRSHYCITTGWCNAPLERTQVLARVERGLRASRRHRSTSDQPDAKK